MLNTTPFNQPFVHKTWYEKSISEFCESAEGITLLGLCNAALNVNYASLEQHIVRDIIKLNCANGSGLTSASSTGILLSTLAGTVSARSLATTNAVTSSLRFSIDSSSSAGSLATLSPGRAHMWFGDPVFGGFTQLSRFYCDDAATVDGARQFTGVFPYSTPTNVEPSTLNAVIGLGNGSSDTNLKIFYGGVAQPPIDLGANFPANTLGLHAYELGIFAFKGVPLAAGYQVKRLGTSYVARGILSATTAGVQLPSSLSNLMGFTSFRTNNATALPVSMGFIELFLGLPNYG